MTGFAVLAVLCCPTAALSWNEAGHRVVARIAQKHLKPMTLRRFHILAGKQASLADLAGWADTVADERPETKPWHYINIRPKATSLDLHRDCPDDDCLPAQLRRSVGVVRLGMRTAAERLDALRFLIHLAGDLHQPLHAGYRRDRGGNDIAIVFRGQQSTLHSFWDGDLLATMIDDEVAYADRLNQGITAQQKRDWGRDYLTTWVWDSHRLAAETVYAGLPAGDPKELDDAYVGKARTLIEEQLAKAGIRLAEILNRMWAY